MSIFSLLEYYFPEMGTFLLGGLLMWTRNTMYFYQTTWRRFLVWITGRKYIVIWTDDPEPTTEKIIKELQDMGRNKFRYKILKEPDELMYLPSSSNAVRAIIFVVCDVTKLSENEKLRKKVQQKILMYVEGGGVFVGTHDIFYKRCRNEILWNTIGCKLEFFEAHDKPIPVRINQRYAEHPLLRGIPTEIFFLEDKEVITGDWKPAMKQLVLTVNEHTQKKVIVPMVCADWQSRKGIVVWISCGDKAAALAPSVARPQKEFIRLLSNAIEYKEDIKSFVA